MDDEDSSVRGCAFESSPTGIHPEGFEQSQKQSPEPVCRTAGPSPGPWSHPEGEEGMAAPGSTAGACVALTQRAGASPVI